MAEHDKQYYQDIHKLVDTLSGFKKSMDSLTEQLKLKNQLTKEELVLEKKKFKHNLNLITEKEKNEIN